MHVLPANAKKKDIKIKEEKKATTSRKPS